MVKIIKSAAVFEVTMEPASNISYGNKKAFLFLWIVCTLTIGSMFLYLYHLESEPFPIWWTFALLILFFALFNAFAFWLINKIISKTDLNIFPQKTIKEIASPALIWGLPLGIAIFLMDKSQFQSPKIPSPTFISDLITSSFATFIGVAISTQFWFSLLYLFICKCYRILPSQRRYALWATNIFIGLLGIFPLSTWYKLDQLTAIQLAQNLFGHAIPSVVFGWLYWSRGLWTVMATTFVSTSFVLICIHIFG
jgi:hypothetical protein